MEASREMAKCKHCKIKVDTPLIRGIYKFCSLEHATEFTIEQMNKQKQRQIVKAKQSQAKKAKAQKTKDKGRLKELTSITSWRSKLQALINQWIVHVRDKDKPCYTCGTTSQSIKYDAGHRHHAGRGGADRRRFILENIHKQCSMICNQHGSGKPREYDIALDNEYGKGFADHLNCEANYPTLKEQFPLWQDIEKEIIRYRALLRDAGVTPNR
jgi:hypothetical protein